MREKSLNDAIDNTVSVVLLTTQAFKFTAANTRASMPTNFRY